MQVRGRPAVKIHAQLEQTGEVERHAATGGRLVQNLAGGSGPKFSSRKRWPRGDRMPLQILWRGSFLRSSTTVSSPASTSRFAAAAAERLPPTMTTSTSRAHPSPHSRVGQVHDRNVGPLRQRVEHPPGIRPRYGRYRDPRASTRWPSRCAMLTGLQGIRIRSGWPVAEGRGSSGSRFGNAYGRTGEPGWRDRHGRPAIRSPADHADRAPL